MEFHGGDYIHSTDGTYVYLGVDDGIYIDEKNDYKREMNIYPETGTIRTTPDAYTNKRIRDQMRRGIREPYDTNSQWDDRRKPGSTINDNQPNGYYMIPSRDGAIKRNDARYITRINHDDMLAKQLTWGSNGDYGRELMSGRDDKCTCPTIAGIGICHCSKNDTPTVIIPVKVLEFILLIVLVALISYLCNVRRSRVSNIRFAESSTNPSALGAGEDDDNDGEYGDMRVPPGYDRYDEPFMDFLDS
jgi:hypothetical protein